MKSQEFFSPKNQNKHFEDPPHYFLTERSPARALHFCTKTLKIFFCDFIEKGGQKLFYIVVPYYLHGQWFSTF